MKMILDYVNGAKRIAISGHVRPDGDCVGSCLALCRYLEKNTEAEISVYLEPVEKRFLGLAGADLIRHELEDDLTDFDLFFSLDCGDADRLGFSEPLLEHAKHTVNLDHHITNTQFAQENVVDANASSTCEVLFKLMEEEKLDKETAECLYTGILHDTGVFHHSCTSPKTMEIAGHLMGFGVPFSKLIDEGFYQRTFLQNQVLGMCLSTSRLLFEGRCIVSFCDGKTIQKMGISSADFSGVIDQLRLTEGVLVAIFLYETAPSAWKVSMRVNGDRIDVSRVASVFGGGGHVKAAGCTVNGSAEEAIGKICQELEPQFCSI